MNVRLDESGYHAPVQFIKLWPIADEYKTALLTGGETKDGMVHIPLARYKEIEQQFNPSEVITTPPQPYVHSPGALLSLIIRKITGKSSAACAVCGKRGKQMNAWGWLGCLKNRRVIVQWLVEEAGKLGYKIDKHVMVGLLRAAIKESRGQRR